MNTQHSAPVLDEALTRQQASDGAPGWRLLLGALELAVECASPAEALELVAELGRVGDQLGALPDIDLRGTLLHLAIRQPGGPTRRSLVIARAVGELITRWGLEPRPELLASWEVAIDTLDVDAVRPFWRALTGHLDDGPDALVDPQRLGPAIWFQQMDEPRVQRNRIHLDVTVAHDQAPARLAAALAAGGVLVSDEAAPAFWILADREGNEACLCTWQGRD